MTKLEWCKEHAPEALKSVSDSELLETMSSSYYRFCRDYENVKFSEIGVSTVSRKLDYMFEILVASLVSPIKKDSVNSHDYVKEMLYAVGEFLTRNDVVFSYTVNSNSINESINTIVFRESGGRELLSVNIKIGNGTSDVTDYIIRDTKCMYFRPERIVSDKLLHVVNNNKLRRVKDLYYLYMMTEMCDLNLKLINNFIKANNKIFDSSSRWILSKDLLESFGNDYDKLRVYNADDTVIVKVDFLTAINRVSELFTMVCAQQHNSCYIWDANSKLEVKAY